ncbi:membrane hypothetical protein [Vibrio coralliirubri]|uniref:oligosaccharide flippase family protein n=1 Tax=Vibrio coralliirubri TaxID=1516159 RepID=UPI0006396A54|nr:oligosaccharide flippase family protein [Vibrio coralliirubri]CDT89256.1 membrane hypothetical protein [Vibrio coralliirubri]
MKYSDLISFNQLFALIAKFVEGTKVIFFNLVVARVYGPELFGNFVYITSLISIVAVLAEFRLQSILVRELSAKTHKKSVLLGSALAINVFFAFVGILVVFIFNKFENDPTLSIAIIIYSMVYLYKIPRIFRAYFISIEKNVFIAKCEVIAALTTLAIFIPVAMKGLKLEYLVAIRGLDFLFLSILLVLFYLFSNKISNFSYSWGVVKSLTISAAPFVLSGAAMILFQRLDIILVKNLINAETAGIYASATNIMVMFCLVPIVVSETLAPKLFRGRQNCDVFERKFMSIVVLIGILMSFLMFVIGNSLIYLIYGEAFKGASDVLAILSISPMLISLGASAGQIIILNNTQSMVYIKSIVGCVITLFANYYFIPIYGMEGAAFSSLLGLLFANFIAHYFILSYKKLFFLQVSSLQVLISNAARILKDGIQR